MSRTDLWLYNWVYELVLTSDDDGGDNIFLVPEVLFHPSNFTPSPVNLQTCCKPRSAVCHDNPDLAFLQESLCDSLHCINVLFSYARCGWVRVFARVHTHHPDPALLRQVLPAEGLEDPGQCEARSELASCRDERNKLQLCG